MAQPQREWFEKDYYATLGVSKAATEKDITKAYRKLAKENHPDSHPGREEKFKEISSAYAVLSDTDKRASYDEVRAAGPSAYGFGGGGGGGGQGGFRVDDLSDLLGGVFGRGQKRRGQPGPRRGDDLEASLTLSFDDAVAGATTEVNIVAQGPCETCHATGAAPGTTSTICSGCGGRGAVDSNQGFFSFSQPCSRCGGTGMKIESPCPSCRGTGGAVKPRRVKVRVPAGVEDGQKIRLKHRGGIGFNGGPPGDLMVTVRVGGHTLFGRKGKDLTLIAPITYPEAVLGTTISIPTLDGRVSLRVPPGSKSGRVLRAKGKGALAAGGAGDLLVTLEIVVPTEPTASEKAAIEQLAAATAGANPRSHL
jgi:molecular chaperone DnaJ